MSAMIHIRDPIHGTLAITPREIRLVDQPAFQRLRMVKQLGFSDLAFPGATHTRYVHSMGAMHVATRLFDRLLRPGDLPESVRLRFRQAVRLAVLFHDVGHAPLSHATEMVMPPVRELNLGTYTTNEDRQATHEDYTLKIILDSSIGAEIRQSFDDIDLLPEDVVELIHHGLPTARFRHRGIDYVPLLRQLVSSEMDADRMDYLQRDSFYCGVNYGKFDADWLIDNVVPVELDGAMHLGIKKRATFSFEDFLLSRYHMFGSVYLHYTSVVFEKMLQRYFDEAQDEFALPAGVEDYVALDDLELWSALRKSKNPWAKRIVDRRPYLLLDEVKSVEESSDPDLHDRLSAALQAEGIDVIDTRSRSRLSKYYGQPSASPLFVVTSPGRAELMQEYSALYRRYQSPALLSRVFVPPEHRKRARAILADLAPPAKSAARPLDRRRR